MRHRQAFARFCQREGFSVRETQIPHGLRCDIEHGAARLNVNFYQSGKVLVQGKQSPLKEAIDAFFQATTAPPSASPLARLRQLDHSGVDESGKGDYFGPLAVSGVYLPQAKVEQVRSWGVQDSKQLSDKEIMAIAVRIEQHLVHRSLVFPPPLYNERYRHFKNLNKLLAYAHAKVISALVAETDCARVIADKFAAAHLIPSYLSGTSRIELTQITKAERDAAVACASIVARANFLRGLATLSQQHGIAFLKGASKRVKQQARAFAAQHGTASLEAVAKTHFKMLDNSASE